MALLKLKMALHVGRRMADWRNIQKVCSTMTKEDTGLCVYFTLGYRYADFGDVTHTPTLFGLTERHEITEHAFRVGLSYRFSGFGGPVVARY